MTVRPYLVNGEWRTGDGTFEVKNPYDESLVAEIAIPTADGRHVRGVAAPVGRGALDRAGPHLPSPRGDPR